jgi:hypothetical protein
MRCFSAGAGVARPGVMWLRPLPTEHYYLRLEGAT